MKAAKAREELLQAAFRCGFLTGALIALIIEVLASLHFVGNTVSADCLVTQMLLKWPNEFCIGFLSDAAVVWLASTTHWYLYGELLHRRENENSIAIPEKRFSSPLKGIYLIALLPLALVVGYFSATILMTELLDRPGVINNRCELVQTQSS